MSAQHLPESAEVVVIGAGVQGLACARRLARGLPSGSVVVVDRHVPGAGASGISGGLVRGFYRSPPMLELVRRSVEWFEEDADALGFHAIGYRAIVGPGQIEDLEAIHAAQAAAGYASELVTGAACAEAVRWTWPDADTRGVAAVLHEHRSGYADPAATVRRLAEQATVAGARIVTHTDVLGVERSAGAVSAVVTDRGDVRCAHVVAAPGPWAPELLGRLGVLMPLRFVKAREGDLELAGPPLAARSGPQPPVVHLDQDGPLLSDRDGRELHPGPWGIYFRIGRDGRSASGGVLPEPVPADLPLEPYGHDNPLHVAGDEFTELFTSGLAHLLPSLRGRSGDWRGRPHGGVLALTDDGYPVAGEVAPGLTLIADSGHAFKLLALGDLAGSEVLGAREGALEAFRLERFAAGARHVASHSPYPWT